MRKKQEGGFSYPPRHLCGQESPHSHLPAQRSDGERHRRRECGNQEGDFASIVGPSGSGKSTYLLMLGGMLSPSEGKTILMVTHDMRAAEKAKRKLWLREGKFYTSDPMAAQK